MVYSHIAFADSNVVVTVPDSSEPMEEQQTSSETAPPSQKKISFCIKTKSDYCVDTLCRYTNDPACHAKCQKHAAAKCNPSQYNQDAKTKSNTYDKVMDVADTLNDCIAGCSKSTDRNCSHQCKANAKKAVGK